MTIEDLRSKVREWDSRIDSDSPVADAKYSYILHQLEHHASREWKLYLPAEHPDSNPNYLDRLAQWIGNVTSDDDQKVLLEYAHYISFFSHEDFSALYRAAFNREVMRWTSEQLNCRLEANSLKRFDQIVQCNIKCRTWFCPITDSMDINEFFKVNHLVGVGHRPCFRTLHKLAEDSGPKNVLLAENLRHYANSLSLERLVLLEDIVGSGSQCIEAVRWAVENLKMPVLFVPLILCPNGIESLHNEVSRFAGRLTVRPVIELRRSDLLGPERMGDAGWPISEKMETLARTCSNGPIKGIDPFGYRSTGCSIATFANTPDNTIPIVHYSKAKDHWEPLFPRVFRD